MSSAFSSRASDAFCLVYDSEMSSFETSRLHCQSLSLNDYSKLEQGIEPTWDGFSNPYKYLIAGPNPLKYRIPKVKRNPEFAEIALFLAIELDSKTIIGSAGFHDFPDERGMIEIGFRIVPEMQNQGYGREILGGAWKMICKYPRVKILRYTVSPKNESSIHIVNSLGFKRVGEQIDREDGLELIFEESAKSYLSKHL